MELFAQLSILVVIATLVAVVMRLLRQPLIIGHILTGLIVGPFVLDLVHSAETLLLMGEIGIAILLFTVGLHLNPDLIRQFGRVSVLTGIGQVIFTSIAGYAICVGLGFSAVESFYISVALAFSSTIIILKLITDKGDLEALYAKIAIGFLLVQDFIVVLLILGIPVFSAGNASPWDVARFALVGGILIAFVYTASRLFSRYASAFVEQSPEFLFLFALSWGIGIAALFRVFGFPLESGALLAGISLANLPARLEISSRLTPLRDFFVVIFFVYLGSQLQLGNVVALLPTAAILSILVLIGNPLILMTIMGILGYRKKTSLQTGLTVAQISEFSLVFVALGVQLGHLDTSILSLVTLVGIITIFGSTYLILYSDAIYRLLSPFLAIFERKDAHESRSRRGAYDIVLFGCNRIGHDFVQALERTHRRFLVIDYDPEIVKNLETNGVATIFGDASNVTFLETLDFIGSELVISTIPDPETNACIHRVVRAQNPETVVMVVAHKIKDALSHYDSGVDYVILPHFLGARHAAELVLKFKHDKNKYKELRKEHIEHLQLRVAIGHEHPHTSG